MNIFLYDFYVEQLALYSDDWSIVLASLLIIVREIRIRIGVLTPLVWTIVDFNRQPHNVRYYFNKVVFNLLYQLSRLFYSSNKNGKIVYA